ncbi:structural protein [Rhizobium phage RHph_I1_18]|nr:structural protein [Rhizobium phage RHph_I1_18]
MAVSNFTYEIKSVIVLKFANLIGGIPTKADLKTSIDITPQVREINLFQSIFMPYMKTEIAVVDPIGLFVNFPLSGEEAVFITYKDVNADKTYTLPFIIDTVNYISVSDKAREAAYMINCVAVEAYANAKQTIQEAYHDTAPNIIKQIFDKHIVKRTQDVFRAYTPVPLLVDNNDALSGTIVIPNMLPFEAIKMVSELYVSTTEGRDTPLFFQTPLNFNFTSMQALYDPTTRAATRRKAHRLKYKYQSNEINDPNTKLENDGRIITNLVYNKRYSSLEKLALGYFHNVLFEVNIAQKAVWGEPRKIEDLKTIYPNKLNTKAFQDLATIKDQDAEKSNRTRYVITTQRENDNQFPVSRQRDRWGGDIQTLIAMGQIDLTITIPGTSQFTAGDLIEIDIPEVHAFNTLKADDLVSGIFVIAEIKHIFGHGGVHSTVMRINKDSYTSSIDRPSRYA